MTSGGKSLSWPTCKNIKLFTEWSNQWRKECKFNIVMTFRFCVGFGSNKTKSFTSDFMSKHEIKFTTHRLSTLHGTLCANMKSSSQHIDCQHSMVHCVQTWNQVHNTSTVNTPWYTVCKHEIKFTTHRLSTLHGTLCANMKSSSQHIDCQHSMVHCVQTWNQVHNTSTVNTPWYTVCKHEIKFTTHRLSTLHGTLCANMKSSSQHIDCQHSMVHCVQTWNQVHNTSTVNTPWYTVCKPQSMFRKPVILNK